MAKRKTTKIRVKKGQHPIGEAAKPLTNLDMEVTKKDQFGRTLGANTLIYVHGIGNKPITSVLRCQWDQALFEQRMGDRTRMAYWVNRKRYNQPFPAQCGDADTTEMGWEEGMGAAAFGLSEISDEEFIDRLGFRDQVALEFLNQINGACRNEEPEVPGTVSPRIWNWVIGRPLNVVFRLTRRAFLADVYDFFFDETQKGIMLQSVRSRIETGGGPFVIVGHSQGTMIAYEILRSLNPEECSVPLFVTIGSPLGLAPVRDRFRKWTGRRKLPFPECVDRWINVANAGDIVALDSDLSNDIEDANGERFRNYLIESPNEELRADPHSASGYLKTKEVRNEIRQIVGNDFAQPVGFQVIGSDLVEVAEQAAEGVRIPALIELESERSNQNGETIEKLRKNLKQRILEMVGNDPGIDDCKRYIAVPLTENELERLRSRYGSLKIHRIWRNMDKHALISQSRITIQAGVANLSYEAEGQGITWAVLDSGIDSQHPHFEKHQNVKRLWDCTATGITEIGLTGANLDRNGHGTHVAGIIAGDWQEKNEAERYAGMAPRTRLHGFKVLDDNGRGRDSFIIKALDKIADINDSAGRLEIHGVNLSLGGNFDPSVYGCGHTPLCNELRRLWRQGVVVVIAAGNEGYEMLLKATGGARPTNLDLSIGDPANLEEAIAVGSVHRERPHSFGVSFFSSRGPTADGRRKPDLVAPGEKILSARTGARGRKESELYVQASGTSMAAPHVSGILAAFLSIRREFIGSPDHLKQLLLKNCTDLGRDPYLQGAGMPNLIRMLAGT